MTDRFPEIRDLAIIGDRRTAALLTKVGAIVWYCPNQFDLPSLFAALLDPKAGSWSFQLTNATFASRRYLEASGVLETIFHTLLAGTFWVAQYWVMRQEFERVYAILDAALKYANDLGLFAEEADPHTGQMLGNFPQTFVHAAFIGAVVDLKAALEKK